MKISLLSRAPWLLLASVGALALSAVGCADRGADASEYPTRTIEVVVPYPAGSGIDTTTRALAEIINDSGDLGQDLQIVNREGGGGSVGTTEILNAEPDGYTVGVVPDGPLTLVPQTEDVAYDPESITVLNEIIRSPIMFVVPKDSPFQNLDDLTQGAKADPSSITIGEGPLNYAVPADQFEIESGTRLKHVDFDGDQATMTALLGNNVDVGVMQLASALPSLKSGQIRALGVTAAETIDLIPDVKTFNDQGIDIEWEAYNIAIAPDGLPEDVRQKLADVFAAAVESDEFADAAETLGLIVSGAGPEEATDHLNSKTESSASVLGD